MIAAGAFITGAVREMMAWRSTSLASLARQVPIIRRFTPMRHTLSELTGPVYGHETVREQDHDLNDRFPAEAIGLAVLVRGEREREDRDQQ